MALATGSNGMQVSQQRGIPLKGRARSTLQPPLTGICPLCGLGVEDEQEVLRKVLILQQVTYFVGLRQARSLQIKSHTVCQNSTYYGTVPLKQHARLT